MPDPSPEKPATSRWKRWLSQAILTAVWFGALFGGAGRLDWVRGWIYVAAYACGMTAIAVWVRRANPEVFEARSKWLRKNTKGFDKIFLSIFLPLTLLQPAVGGLDAVRFGWSSIPFGFVYPAVIVLLASLALIGWTLAVNRHAEATVRIQTERRHKVVTSGPYRFVRHPMYVGTIPMYIASSVILGSVWALVISGAIAVLFIVRTALEDRTLRRELEGYEDYAARTQWRLIPGVW